MRGFRLKFLRSDVRGSTEYVCDESISRALKWNPVSGKISCEARVYSCQRQKIHDYGTYCVS